MNTSDRNIGDVLIVGGGISGIQAALDLANSGFRVFLVDKSPALGGKMSQLDKTFPTNDCSMCIESPKFIECARNPNIEIITYTEVERVDGEAGDFRVTLTKKPRYISEEKCTGCNICVDYCPVKIPDPFNQNLSENKAVHIYFSQAVPLVTYVDPETCLYLKEGKCQICVGACKTKAIDLHQKPETMVVEVGAIILSPGYETFNPKLRGDFGYGRMQNVVTSLDFERILCATGPYEGEILRPSDKKHPHKIAWIQCVGSRQVNEGGNNYCSAVCCAYSQKQVILAKDHDADLQATIFHNDVRAYGKDFERFHQRAEKLSDVRFVRSYVTIGREIESTKNVTIRYSTVDDGVKEEEFDMVVLSVGLNPPKDVEALASKIGIELTDQKFCKNNPYNPIETSRKGVFVSGAFQGPLDIPESVVTASGAGALCGQLLSYRRGRLERERVYPPEKDVSQEELKIGVVVCYCGANIGRVVNIPEVIEYAATLPNVAWAGENLFACSTENAKQISDAIVAKGLNRVVLAACTPRTHEPLFRDTCREAGLNQYFFEFANIREHCSWVHSREKESATQKAKEIVRMSVARAAHLEPLQEFQLPVDHTGLVVGGGVAGMTAALNMAEQGFEVYLIEKDDDLGGMARRLHYTLEGMDVQSFLADLVKKVYRHPRVHVWTDANITDVSGYVGNFVTTVTSQGRNREVKHGVAVIATGAQEYKPTEYLYGESDRVLTQLELEGEIVSQSEKVTGAQSVVMIQCVGCRQADRNYCSRVCCSQAIKNAHKLKEINPEMEIQIIFRDMRTYGLKETYYREASEKNVKFIRYEAETKPVVEAAGDGFKVTVPDPVLGQMMELEADLVVLAAAVIPAESSQDAGKLFKVSNNPDGFFQEAHVKLRPVDFAADGVFLCGTAHYPKHLSETISQAYGAAGRAVGILSRETVTASGAVCDVTESDCVSCGACITACKYGAISFVDTPNGKKARVEPILCKGDGLCNAKCPTGAIYLKHYTDDEICAQIDAAFPEH
ncbi:polyferredoxin, putative benzoyl-CoA reductase electron transfer protein [Geobacter metallireducens GS-15]|uniref:Polyferredoxin, putative benzoyl-CoA reductase electron transfer protein n=1 Tax=Geobacter metallireducens (strain ATCC 53774 / DSM 7210 / GS-15) TaxID=269799 RepID=Q39TW1_GEOMG|nr:FAD-dependent oxidoreductase [Geobacter metallireducens]ABB32313.1 polyferredoxin, putative benzoyl-CoA reductase electron transfer protein [Geobacter metallireducens GS-15]